MNRTWLVALGGLVALAVIGLALAARHAPEQQASGGPSVKPASVTADASPLAARPTPPPEAAPAPDAHVPQVRAPDPRDPPIPADDVVLTEPPWAGKTRSEWRQILRARIASKQVQLHKIEESLANAKDQPSRDRFLRVRKDFGNSIALDEEQLQSIETAR